MAKNIYLYALFISLFAVCGAGCLGTNVSKTASSAVLESEKIKTVLVGTDDGLFAVSPSGELTEAWTGGSVKKILSLPNESWAIMGSEGIMFSADLQNWETRNQGLPVKTIKVFQNGQRSFLQITQELKDFEINPENPQIMVCATNNRVYISRNQGQSWTSLGAPDNMANGIKAVAAASMPGAGGGSDLTVFMSHSIYGVYYIQPDRLDAAWTNLSDGLEKLETTDNADEVADIAVMIPQAGRTNTAPEIFVSQTFRRRIYKLDWEWKSFELIWSDASPFGTVDSLYPQKDNLLFLHEGTAASLAYNNFSFQKQDGILTTIRSVSAQNRLNCIVMEYLNSSNKIILSELWLLDEPEPGQPTPPSAHIAANREGLYLPVNHSMDSTSLAPYLNTIQRAGLNMIVIDIKDDYGRLRFTPNNKAISEKGRVFRPLDIDAFLRDMKNRGIYTVARVVVFKDPELARKENSKFAVWDARNNAPWRGYDDSRRRTDSITEDERANELRQFFPTSNPDFEIVRSFYDETWVDPYSEEVWEYIAVLSQELYERGFDEIQFDYIRFPTDGDNLRDARYRWQDRGMDMESAMLSFLRHVRSRLEAPVSIDIYGANGWYRTGARTGQEVELLAPWIDVICPMYYPSHFEQDFLAQNPPEMRPWRIYYIGALRNSRIARGQVIVRPWTQAFYMNVSYDRQYYNNDYVRRQIEGVRMAGNGGYTHWNNLGRYDDIPDK